MGDILGPIGVLLYPPFWNSFLNGFINKI